MDRREFLKVSAAAAAGLIISEKAKAMASKKNMDKSFVGMPRRRLGKTGAQLSIIGMGAIVVMNADQDVANRTVADAVRRGVNYFDVAPSYGDAQNKLGPALKPFRDNCFLACKSTQRDKAGVEKELKDSLAVLQTDYFDLYQLHAITDPEKDVAAALGKGGAIETLIEARKNGIIRHIGFSAHSVEAAMKAMREFDFDTIMYPVNFASHYNSGFDDEVLAEAKKRDMGIVAIKAMMKGVATEESKKKHPKCWYEPVEEAQLAALAISWTLQQGATACLPPGDERLFEMALGTVEKISNLTDEQEAGLKIIARKLTPAFPISK